MVECSPDCPKYDDCDFEICVYEDDYIDDSLNSGKMIKK